MSWAPGVGDKAVTVKDFSASGYEYNGTSCSSILLGDVGAWRLRMYGVSEGALVRLGAGSSFTTSAPECDLTSRFVMPYADSGSLDTQEYIESDTWSVRGSFIGTIVLDKSTDSVYKTCVPRQLGLRAVTRYRLDSVGSEGVAIAEPANRCKVEYKDVHVLKLPGDQGWLMLLGRYIAEGDVSFDPSNSISQVVAWWSNTEDFTGYYVVGPLLLVDAARCLAVDQGVRLWVGVPSAVALAAEGGDGYDLFVYYAVDECGIGYSSLSLGRSKGGGSTKGGHEFRFADQISSSAYQAELNRLEFSAGVAVKRIPLSTLMDTVASEITRVLAYGSSGRYATNEDNWAPDFALDGDLLGQVRFWFPDATYSGRLHAFDTYYPLEALRPADPTPVTCRGSGGLSLFVAMIGGEATDIEPADPSAGTLGSGHGLWRGAGMSGGDLYLDLDDPIEPVVILTTKGKDFVVQSPLDRSDIVSPDQVAEAGPYTFNPNNSPASSGTAQWIDPDPVQLDDGSWWVATGAAAGDMVTTYMTVFKGRSEPGTWLTSQTGDMVDTSEGGACALAGGQQGGTQERLRRGRAGGRDADG